LAQFVESQKIDQPTKRIQSIKPIEGIQYSTFFYNFSVYDRGKKLFERLN